MVNATVTCGIVKCCEKKGTQQNVAWGLLGHRDRKMSLVTTYHMTAPLESGSLALARSSFNQRLVAHLELITRVHLLENTLLYKNNPSNNTEHRSVMGITGSLPLRWSTPAKSGVEMGSTDSKGMPPSKLTFMFLVHFLCRQDVDNHSEHPQLVPTIPIPNHSRVSSSVTTTTLIGSSPLKSLDCRTDSSCIISMSASDRFSIRFT